MFPPLLLQIKVCLGLFFSFFRNYIFIEEAFCAPVSVCVYHSFVITRLNSDSLLMALVHPPVEKSQF